MSLLYTLRPNTMTAGPTLGDGQVLIGPADPMSPGAREATRGVAQDVYFFTSIEDYPPGIGDLELSHDDVQGFYDYVNQFNTPNGWYRDSSVGQWIYEETYDNYLDDFGFDAAKVVYHAGHGTMDDNGVYWLPVGSDWGGDAWTSSNDMRLGNEYARYLFWSTCLSLRTKDGHSPYRTWSAANLGLRMIFGYETLMADSGDYGKFFFEEWNRPKSFSSAFMDASWRISTNQVPVVSATGVTQAEASDRVFNESRFQGDRADTSWWWWRWYDAARARNRNLGLPNGARSVKLAAASGRDLASWTERFGGGVPRGIGEQEVRRGVVFGGDVGPRISIGPDGSRDVRLAETAESRGQISADQAIKVAQRTIGQYRLAENVDLILDHVRYDRHAGASADERVDESVREVTVTFVQVVDGIPVVSPDGGQLQIRVDNDRTVTGIADSTREVLEVREQPAVPPRPGARRPSSPLARGAGNSSANIDGGIPATGTPVVDDVLDGALQRRLRRAASGGQVPSSIREVPGSTEVGYALRDGDAVLVARCEVELRFGHGLAKRYVLEEPIDN
jgi:Family of unknown function (DUF6345)